MKLRLTANQASASVHGGKRTKNSLQGAMLAARDLVENGFAEQTSDDLKVSPLDKESEIWNWTQPILSSGGHIVGAPIPTTSLQEAMQIGAHTLEGLLHKNTEYMANKPEYATPLLFVLYSSLEDASQFTDLGRQLLGACRYGHQSPLKKDTAAASYKDVMLERVKHPNIVAYLRDQEFYEDYETAEASVPRWREIKKQFSCSNKTARYTRRLMVSKFAKLCLKLKIRDLRDFCLGPVEVEGSHPVTSFVEQCWALRGSSISCQLPKRPPADVYNLLAKFGIQRGEINKDSEAALRRCILGKMEAFQDWVERQHGYDSDPSVWSDTLSKFASRVNPMIGRYNQFGLKNQADKGFCPLLHVTSFVPADLSPEMYYFYRRQATGYFFTGYGRYYKYSENWRRDAVIALYNELLPASVDALKEVDLEVMRGVISYDLAYQGGQALLDGLFSIGVSEERFTKFLRQYYWSGAFLNANLRLLRYSDV